MSTALGEDEDSEETAVIETEEEPKSSAVFRLTNNGYEENCDGPNTTLTDAMGSIFASAGQLFDEEQVYGPANDSSSIGSATEAAEEFASSLEEENDDQSALNEGTTVQLLESEGDGNAMSLPTMSHQFPTADDHDVNQGFAGQQRFLELQQQQQQQLSVLNHHQQPPPPPPLPMNWLTNSVAAQAQMPTSIQALLSGGVPQRSHLQMLPTHAQQHVGAMFPRQQQQQQQRTPTNNVLIPNATLPFLHPLAQTSGSSPFSYCLPGSNPNGPFKPTAMATPFLVPLMAANASSYSTRSMLPNMIAHGGSIGLLPATLNPGKIPTAGARPVKRTLKGAIGGGSIEPFPVRFVLC